MCLVVTLPSEAVGSSRGQRARVPPGVVSRPAGGHTKRAADTPAPDSFRTWRVLRPLAERRGDRAGGCAVCPQSSSLQAVHGAVWRPRGEGRAGTLGGGSCGDPGHARRQHSGAVTANLRLEAPHRPARSRHDRKGSLEQPVRPATRGTPRSAPPTPPAGGQRSREESAGTLRGLVPRLDARSRQTPGRAFAGPRGSGRRGAGGWQGEGPPGCAHRTSWLCGGRHLRDSLAQHALGTGQGGQHALWVLGSGRAWLSVPWALLCEQGPDNCPVGSCEDAWPVSCGWAECHGHRHLYSEPERQDGGGRGRGDTQGWSCTN